MERERQTDRRVVVRTLGRKGRKDGKSSVTGHITGKSEKEWVKWEGTGETGSKCFWGFMIMETDWPSSD